MSGGLNEHLGDNEPDPLTDCPVHVFDLEDPYGYLYDREGDGASDGGEWRAANPGCDGPECWAHKVYMRAYGAEVAKDRAERRAEVEGRRGFAEAIARGRHWTPKGVEAGHIDAWIGWHHEYAEMEPGDERLIPGGWIDDLFDGLEDAYDEWANGRAARPARCCKTRSNGRVRV